jgi:hypothetical protein
LDAGIVGVPELLRAPLKLALQAIQRVLKRFRFYGYGELQKEWNSAFGAYAATAVAGASPTTSQGVASWKQIGKVIATLYGVLSVVNTTVDVGLKIAHGGTAIQQFLADHSTPPAPGDPQPPFPDDGVLPKRDERDTAAPRSGGSQKL